MLGAGVVFFGYKYYSRDLPKFDDINSYQPPAASQIFAKDGTLLAEDYFERRYPVSIRKVPKHVIQAFLAAEDADFYNHPGVDIFSILRALKKNIEQGSASQGGSTITQQVIKNLLLTNEKKLERKIKEAILAFKIEKRLSKDEILELYLNQIFFGNTAYGVQAASEVYFRKDISDISIAEAALLAGLPQAPSRYSPTKNFKQAKRRQRYVISQMYQAHFISVAQKEAAEKEKLTIYHAINNKYRNAPYYASEVFRIMKEKFSEYDLSREGLKIYAAIDLKAQNYANLALQQGLREVDKRRGYRGAINNLESEADFLEKYGKSLPLEPEENKLYPGFIMEIALKSFTVSLGKIIQDINFKDISWAKKTIDQKDKVQWKKAEDLFKKGDVIEVSFNDKKEMQLDQTPLVEGAAVMLNPHNGEVLAVAGGYDFHRSVFNRVTQSLRQPGSAFKPIVYFTAIDAFGYTASTLVYDEPRTFRVGNQLWTPGNFDGKYMGVIPLRTALEKSRNLVSADIISKIGIDPVIRYARKMGITSPLGRNLSLSLGSSEVTPLELTRAYGVFPAHGYLFQSVFIDRIEDRNGNEIYNYRTKLVENSRKVADEKSTSIMAHLMQGVVQNGTGWKVKALERPAAGKTGTSNDQMDAWFVGYTPEYAAGVWVGFDVKKEIGKKETGGQAAAPVWLNMMKSYLDDKDSSALEREIKITHQEAEELGIVYQEPPKPEPAKFQIADGLDSYWVQKTSGRLSSKGTPGSILEYYLPGTSPVRKAEEDENANYWELEE